MGEKFADVRPRTGAPEVLSEVFEDEAVVVQLTTGIYYAFDRTTTEWWVALLSATTLGEAARSLDDNAPPVDQMAEFAAFLSSEQLADFDGPLPESPEEWPGVERFNDMADLLTLDPIHGVNPETGWPVANRVTPTT